jgi:hypothetical protein
MSTVYGLLPYLTLWIIEDGPDGSYYFFLVGVYCRGGEMLRENSETAERCNADGYGV